MYNNGYAANIFYSSWQRFFTGSMTRLSTIVFPANSIPVFYKQRVLYSFDVSDRDRFPRKMAISMKGPCSVGIFVCQRGCHTVASRACSRRERRLISILDTVHLANYNGENLHNTPCIMHASTLKFATVYLCLMRLQLLTLKYVFWDGRLALWSQTCS